MALDSIAYLRKGWLWFQSYHTLCWSKVSHIQSGYIFHPYFSVVICGRYILFIAKTQCLFN